VAPILQADKKFEFFRAVPQQTRSRWKIKVMVLSTKPEIDKGLSIFMNIDCIDRLYRCAANVATLLGAATEPATS